MQLAGYENGNGMIAEGDIEGENIKRKFLHFLNEFIIPSQDRNQQFIYYRNEVATMIKNKRTTLYVDYIHLMEFDAELSEYINLNYYR